MSDTREDVKMEEAYPPFLLVKKKKKRLYQAPKDFVKSSIIQLRVKMPQDIANEVHNLNKQKKSHSSLFLRTPRNAMHPTHAHR